jgi:phosphotransferase system IIB component
MGQYTDGAADLIAAVGGKDNIEALTNCVTRLRFRPAG